MRAFVLLLALPLAGCCLFQSPDATLVRGVESYTGPVLEEYEKYVIRREPLPSVKPEELDSRWKKPRQDSVDGLRKLIKEAKD